MIYAEICCIMKILTKRNNKKEEFMSQERIVDFIDFFKKNYAINRYEDESLSTEDKLYLLGSLSSFSGQEGQTEEDCLNAIKAQDKYKDYFNITKNIEMPNLNSALAEAIESFIESDVEGKRGIEYSDKKQALSADGELFNEETIKCLCEGKGLNIADVKKLLAPQLDKYLKDKMAYFKIAMQNMHGLYSYAGIEK